MIVQHKDYFLNEGAGREESIGVQRIEAKQRQGPQKVGKAQEAIYGNVAELKAKITWESEVMSPSPPKSCLRGTSSRSTAGFAAVLRPT